MSLFDWGRESRARAHGCLSISRSSFLIHLLIQGNVLCARPKRAGTKKSWQEHKQKRGTTDATASTAKRRRHVYMETILSFSTIVGKCKCWCTISTETVFYITIYFHGYFPISFSCFFPFFLFRTSCSWLMGGGREHSDTPLSPLACMYAVWFESVSECCILCVCVYVKPAKRDSVNPPFFSCLVFLVGQGGL